MSPRFKQNLHLVNNFKNTNKTSISSKLELVMWSRDTRRQIPYIDRCQLTITWMFKIKEVRYNQGCMSLSTCLLEYGRHLARLHGRRAYVPTGNAASHDHHEKINSWVSFIFLYRYGAPLGGSSGRRSSAINQL